MDIVIHIVLFARFTDDSTFTKYFPRAREVNYGFILKIVTGKAVVRFK